jgi:hypothetical protein
MLETGETRILIHSSHISGKKANSTATLEDNLVVSTKLNILLPYDPSVVLLDIYQKELKTYVLIKACIQIFIKALLIIVNT